MTAPDKKLDELLSAIGRKERQSLRRVLLWTLVPAAAAGALLGYSALRLRTAADEVGRLEQTANDYRAQAEALRVKAAQRSSDLNRLNVEIASLRSELDQAEQRVRETVDLSRFSHEVDLVDLKMLFSRFPVASQLLARILELRNRKVGWKLGGQRPEEGFDYPSFATYILHDVGTLPNQGVPGETLVAASRRLYDSLPPAPSPQVGDLVFYPSGYAMFYFLDQRQQPFVIGMTPMGIAALNPDFARPDGYRRPQLPR